MATDRHGSDCLRICSRSIFTLYPIFRADDGSDAPPFTYTASRRGVDVVGYASHAGCTLSVSHCPKGHRSIRCNENSKMVGAHVRQPCDPHRYLSIDSPHSTGLSLKVSGGYPLAEENANTDSKLPLAIAYTHLPTLHFSAICLRSKLHPLGC